jgi:hypothetical protein
MRYIITETQYDMLTEQRKDVIQVVMGLIYPEMGRLRKRPTKSMSFGRGYKFFDPKTNDVLFHVVSGGPVFWDNGGGTRPAYPGIRLYVDSSLYDSLSGYLGDFDDKLLDWFNPKYGQQADRVIRGIKN